LKGVGIDSGQQREGVDGLQRDSSRPQADAFEGANAEEKRGLPRSE